MGTMDQGESWNGQESADFQPSKIDRILLRALHDNSIQSRVLKAVGAETIAAVATLVTAQDQNTIQKLEEEFKDDTV